MNLYREATDLEIEMSFDSCMRSQVVEKFVVPVESDAAVVCEIHQNWVILAELPARGDGHYKFVFVPDG